MSALCGVRLSEMNRVITNNLLQLDPCDDYTVTWYVSMDQGSVSWNIPDLEMNFSPQITNHLGNHVSFLCLKKKKESISCIEVSNICIYVDIFTIISVRKINLSRKKKYCKIRNVHVELIPLMFRFKENNSHESE